MCWKFSIPQKKILIFIKYFLDKKIFIKSPYHKRKKCQKTNTHPLSPNTPSHTAKRIIPWKIKKISHSCLGKQPNFSLPCHPRNNPLGLSPSQTKFTYPNPLKWNLFWKGVELPHPILLIEKKPFWKRKKNPNPSSPFLKAPLPTCNSFNLIELSTPYTYWNLIITNKPARKEKKILTPLLSLNFHL